MNKINFILRLTSDAEISSGFGTSLIDSLLPRDSDGNVIVPASHLKGLIRENLELYAGKFITRTAIKRLFGEEGSSEGALFHIDNAIAKDDSIIEVTRTRLNEFGTAQKGSLRTSEAVAKDTCFKGFITLGQGVSDDYINLLKLGLISLNAVGGGRSRGAGACVVTLNNETITPGDLLKTLATVEDWAVVSPVANGSVTGDADKIVTLKLIFKARNAICVPETPIVGNNVIKSGFTIPASAVQGVILHRLNDINEDLATACYENSSFRAWPLGPVESVDSMSVRVSFTHKLSKLTDDDGKHTFRDETVEEYEWDKIPPKSPLKAADGVLLSSTDGIKLWKSAEMARVVTAHGVINGDRGQGQKRNLYTIEALAPITFVGLVSMPEDAANLLKKSLSESDFVTLGKSRSVRGGGSLKVEDIDVEALPLLHNHKNVFIVQSPLQIPEGETGKPVAEIIKSLVAEAGFGNVEVASGSVSTQFGWNRTTANGFLQAVSVIAPGAVFKIDALPENLTEKLIAGIGGGRTRGFGAVLPHPGIATAVYSSPLIRKVHKAVKNYALEGNVLFQKAKDSNLSTSQISRVLELATIGADTAIAYLHKQKADRPAAIWERWSTVMSDIENGLRKDSAYYLKVLKVCQDLLAAEGGRS